jgi:endonuclease I
MQKLSLLVIVLMISVMSFGQQSGYYNGTSDKDGEELKTALHDIIKDHSPYAYRFSKYIFQLSDMDPENAANVILVYTGRSNPNNDYGTGGNKINREHVWAKSHGDFTDWLPMYSDVHNLKPADASVNVAKSNKDFDNGGVAHSEATECFFTDSTWEARDAVKGDIARIIFYMSTRYEGGNGEIDLEVVDWNNTYPNAQHGKLSTLLQWNLLDPPDDFERNRNNVIFSFQKNRNPFIDNPEFAQLIWGEVEANPLSIDNIQISPDVVVATEPIEISATIVNNSKEISTAVLKWGLSYETLTNETSMTANGDVFTANIPAQAEGVTVYYEITAVDGTEEVSSVVYNYYVPKVFTGDLTSIYDIQGQQDESPFKDQVVSTTGIVTANFGDSYFIQNGEGAWNGLLIYELGRNPNVGDSVIVTGKIVEYYDLTEMKEISDFYFISANNALPEPVIIGTGEASEELEGVLTKVLNATCVDANFQDDFGMWKVNDGSGDLKIQNATNFEYEPTLNEAYNISGPMNWTYGEWKIQIRDGNDIAQGTDIQAPTVTSVEPITNTNIKLIFSESVEQTTAEDVANYVIDNDVIIESISQHAFNKSQVNLTVSPLSAGILYFITVDKVADLAGNVMEKQIEEFQFVGIQELFTNGNLNVFPNPAKDKINMSFNLKESAAIEIMLNDISGKQIISKSHLANKGDNQISLDLSNLTKGIYVLNIKTQKGSLNYKVVLK